MKVITVVLLATVVALAAAEVPLVDWSTVEITYHPRNLRSLPERRIHGGQPVVPHSRPFQAGILTRHDAVVGRWGGSLITRRSVLAASHSFFSPLTEVVVVLGAHYITRLEDSQQRFYMNLNDILRHPDFGSHQSDGFNHNRNPNDVAILTLPSEAVLNEFVAIVRLPEGAETTELFTGELATVSGFGRPNPGEMWTDELRSTTNRIITNANCQSLLPFFTIHPSDMCAENTGNGSSCGGDCGGPVTIVRNNERIQIGTVPMGPPCSEGWPDLFVRVNSFLPWIRANAQ